MNMKIGKSFLSGLSRKTFYLMTLFTLLAIAAVGFFVVPTFNNTGVVSAAQVEAGAGQKVNADMLRIALDFRSATEYRVFADEGINSSGNSVIEGAKAEASRDPEQGARIRKDLSDSFNIINQLPTTELTEIASGAYRAGVYSAPTGRLAGEIILDAENNPDAIFIFRLGESLRTESDLHFSLINGAAARNIFFVAAGTATVGEEIDFKGSIMAEDTITVGAGSKVNGRTLSLGGEVVLKDAAVLGSTGVLEICKEAEEEGLTVFGVTSTNILFVFNSNNARNPQPIGAITGLPPGVQILGIDFRPATSFVVISPEGPILGVLYGLGSDSNLYTINQFNANATLVGPLGVALSGTNFGFDFNPVTDQLRVVSDTGQNLSVNPNTGAATVQTPLNSSAMNPELGVSGAGYSNNRNGATTTTLYDIDTDADTLVIQNPPASGTLTTVGSLGVNAIAVNGFDISEVNNTALAALTTIPGGETTSGLFQINLATGMARFISNIGTPGFTGSVRGIAIAPGGSTGLGNPNGLDNRIFQFRIGSLVVQVPVGGCSGPITLPAGPVTIEELLDGFLIPSGTFSGRFRLVDVRRTLGPGTLGTVNLPNRTAVVNIPEATDPTNPLASQTVVTFFNAFAINAVIEICKRPALTVPGGGGIPGGGPVVDIPTPGGGAGTVFQFNVDAILNTTFNVPVGFCSGPIQVNVPTTPGPFPAPADVIVTELGLPGFQLETASTFPADRLNFIQLGFGIDNSNPDCINASETPFVSIPPECITSNPGGGLVSGDVLEGGTASQTTFNFFNRPGPTTVKICKVAGPGIPIGTPFTFEVRGTLSTNAPVFQDPPFPPFSIGVLGLRNVTVLAGPASQGGFCDFVTNLDGSLTRFVVGTSIAINETGFTGVIPGVGPGQVRTASIRSNTGFTPLPSSGCINVGSPGMPPAGTASNLPPFAVPGGVVSLGNGQCNILSGGNPDLEFPPNQPNRFIGSAAIVPARTSKVEVQFTNFIFNPTLLKICKIAGTGIPDNGTRLFTFTTVITNPPVLIGNTFDDRLATPITTVVAAGPASSGGFCQFVNGPFTQTSTNPPIGTFTVGSTVTVTESGGTTGTTTTAITSPTGTVVSPNLTTRAGGLVLGFTGGFNEITFTNTTAAPVAEQRAAFDFDGDGKSDPTIFRSATSTWWYAASSANGQHRAAQFGLPEDKDNLVAADYDGDRKTDYAVYRREGNSGVWYINGSTSGFRAETFGLATDIPQTGDFDGDGKADLAVFRPSNGVWYMMNSSRGFSAVQFGINGDKPVAADYDGDGTTDAAVYRGEGIWHLLRSRDGYTSIKFGLATNVDTPVAADYDGDGKADLAVYRNGGVWHLLRSQSGYISQQFGMAGDKPVPADYNGDGKTDLAIFRSGVWHLLSSGQGEAGQSYSTVDFGNGSDTPVPVR